MRRWPPALVLAAAFAAVVGLYSLATPIFEAPDEVWHYAYVRYLAEGHGLPALTDNESGANQEVAQPPLYYAVAALASGLASDDDLPELMWHNPGFGYQSGGTTNDNKNMLIHTDREAFPWGGAVLAIRLARLASLVFGVGAVLATWGLAREAFPRHPGRALGAAALIALTPQFLFMSGVVSNDSAAAALSTAALWMLARIVNRGSTVRRVLGAGVLIGMAILTKTSCLLLGLPAMVTLILAHRRQPQGARRLLVDLTLVGAAAAAVGGWWYLRNALQYGDPLALQAHVQTLWGRPAPASLGTLLSELPKVFQSYWGAFGWGHVTYPAWVYASIGAAVTLSLTGWMLSLVAQEAPGRGRVLSLAALWVALVLAALLQWMRQVEAPHGRLLFPAAGAAATLLVGGWSALWSRGLRRLVLIGLSAVSLLTPWLVIRPALTPPPTVPPSKAAATVAGPELTFGGTARLVGVAPARTSVAPGEALAVRACWQAVAPMEEDYTVFVHLVGRDNTRVGERHTYPGLGRLPTSLWPVGQAFCDVYRLQVAAGAAAPELYDLVIGLYHADSGERLAARRADGSPVGLPVAAQIRVAPRAPSAPAPDHPLDYQVGEQIELTGYQLSGPVRSDGPLTVTLTWRAEASPDRNYRVFVQLLDESGQIVAQHDGPPRHGRYPTTAWQAGDVVPDVHVLAVPTLPAEEGLRLITGLYDPDTMDRLPAVGPQGPAPNDAIPLPLD
ncbi:MAG: glycosyltransferase family 39 protein [Anaerolineae bacterium]